MSATKTTTKSWGKASMIFSAFLHLITIVAVIFLYLKESPTTQEFAEIDHSHYDYADDSHSHSDYADDSHSHSDYADDSHYHFDYADDSHSHSADEITIDGLIGFGKRGTIERSISDLESKDTKLSREIGQKAKKRHTHY
jgi:hypothetical protein